MADLTTEDKDMGAARIKLDLKKLDNSFVTIGVHNDAGKYTQGKNNPSVAEVAFWQEFGTKTIPETPFIRSAVDTNLRKANLLQDRLLNDVLAGKKSVDTALKTLGFFFQTAIQKRIQTTPSWAKALAPSTANAKLGGGGIRGAIRLIQSGLLLRSITFDVKV